MDAFLSHVREVCSSTPSRN